MAMANPTDAQLGFRPSSAPPLDPGVRNGCRRRSWRIIARPPPWPARPAPALPAVPAVPAAAGARRAVRPCRGDVVANLDAVPGTPGRHGRRHEWRRSAHRRSSISPATAPTCRHAARAQVRDAVAAFKAGGGAGTVKVVGHASSRTANMPVERHLEVIFQKSQARANAVAQDLIKAGVPADKVQIEAVGDSQPVYYESMPKGEDGNRRAEIFVQG